MYDFMHDLDDYFCETYENYDKVVLLPGYKMPVMQASEVREDGRTYAYTLPSSTMRLAKQENKESLLAAFKERCVDASFSFSFRVQSLFARFRDKFSKYAFYKAFAKTRAKYDLSDEDFLNATTCLPEVWKGICSGKYLPTKNFLFTFALVAQISFDDMKGLLRLAGYEFDYKQVADVVLSYLLSSRVYNGEMVARALAEYKVENLFLKGAQNA